MKKIIAIIIFIIIMFPVVCLSGMHLHHIFPQQFSAYFDKHGINPHIYCIFLTEEQHRKLHSSSFDYNKMWKNFIMSNPSTTKEIIWGFAALLLLKAGIKKDLELYDYKTKKPTGEKFPLKKYAKAAIEKGMKLSIAKKTIEYMKKLAHELFSAKRGKLILSKLAKYATIGGVTGGIIGAIFGSAA
jgi:hypothetical protein